MTLFQIPMSDDDQPSLNEMLKEIKAFNEQAKKCSCKEVEAMISSTALKNSGKTYIQVMGRRIAENLSDKKSVIVPVINIRRNNVLEFRFTNISRKKRWIELSTVTIDDWGCAISHNVESAEGLVQGDAVETITLKIRGGGKVLPPGEAQNFWSAGGMVTIPHSEFPFGKAREGLIEVDVNMIVDGIEVEEQAEMLFDATIPDGDVSPL